MGSERRLALSHSRDTWLDGLFAQAISGSGSDPKNFALIAVGSYGREEPSLQSDLDLVVIHKEGVLPDSVAEKLWYPIWDASVHLDHSVRTVKSAREVASTDIKAFTGLLDARYIAGNEELFQEVRNSIHRDWRSQAKNALPQLFEIVADRRKNHGELFQLLEPNIKESYGGLRDAAVLSHLGATWLVDIPHTDWQSAKSFLLDVRDAMSDSGPGDRLRMQSQSAVATALGVESPEALLREVYLAGRKIAYANEVTWYRINQLRNSQEKSRAPLAQGVIDLGNEVTFARNADPKKDPGLLIRLASISAMARKPMAPALLESATPIPTPWSREIRESFVSLLGSDSGLLATWESLEQHGIIEAWFPEWTRVRSAPQFNALHEFTVDRHLLECVIQAKGLVRSVDRPDLLLVAALLHDIGKCQGGDHSDIGARMTEVIAPRMGFDSKETKLLSRLVLLHLFLPEIATKRDLDDPEVIAAVALTVKDAYTLDLLLALSLADGRATGPSLRSKWREGLMTDLAHRVRRYFEGTVHPILPSSLTPAQVLASEAPGLFLDVSRENVGYRVTVGAPDQIGLMAKVAGVLALNRLEVRAAKITTVGDRAVQQWLIRPLFGEPPAQAALLTDLSRTLAGYFDLAGALDKRSANNAKKHAGMNPTRPYIGIDRVSDSQVVLEVRASDSPALLYRIATCISRVGVQVTGAKISTLGVDTVDVFFIREGNGKELTKASAKSLIYAIESELTPTPAHSPVTLE